jgi:hypothetical protein
VSGIIYVGGPDFPAVGLHLFNPRHPLWFIRTPRENNSTGNTQHKIMDIINSGDSIAEGFHGIPVEPLSIADIGNCEESEHQTPGPIKPSKSKKKRASPMENKPKNKISAKYIWMRVDNEEDRKTLVDIIEKTKPCNRRYQNLCMALCKDSGDLLVIKKPREDGKKPGVVHLANGTATFQSGFRLNEEPERIMTRHQRTLRAFAEAIGSRLNKDPSQVVYSEEAFGVKHHRELIELDTNKN